MPKRPDEHVVGDIAAGAVAQIFRECGCAVEAVEHDYGEDLLVQTAHNTLVDPSRLWVQVKGTRNMDTYGDGHRGYKVPISTEHLLKWMQSSDTVVVVLWDITKQQGLSDAPMRTQKWGLERSGRKTSYIRFNKEQTDLWPFGPFNHRNARRLVWYSRLQHYEGLMGRALATDIETVERGLDDHAVVPLVAWDFLRLIGLWTGHEVDPDSVKLFWHTVDEHQDLDDPEAAAALVVVVDRVDRATDRLGLPQRQLMPLAAFTRRLIAGDMRHVWDPSAHKPTGEAPP